jgi:hypothetical protein
VVAESESGYRSDRFAVLAEVAQVLADDKRRSGFRDDPVSAVAGFDSLPEDLQATLRSMSDEELAATGRMNAALIDSGFAVENDRNRLGIF